MKNAERVLVYSGLVVALALGLGWRGQTPTSVALAQDARLAAAPLKIGTVDMVELVERLYGRDALAADRTASEAKLRELQDTLTGMQQRISQMQQGTPEFQREAQAFQAKQQALQEGANQYEALKATQVGESYAAVRAAADAVAARLGYTLVFASRPPALPMAAGSVPAAVNEMLARPVVRRIDADDITEAVKAELKIDAGVTVTPVEIKPVQPAPAAADQPPAPGPTQPR